MKPSRYSVGEDVGIGGRLARFVSILDFDRYMVRFDNGDTRVVTSAQIDPANPVVLPRLHYDDCSPDEIAEAYRWFGALSDVLTGKLAHGEKEAAVVKAAGVLGVDRATVYRRIERYDGDPISLLLGRKAGARRKGRLGDERDALLEHVIDQEYLNRKQRSPIEVYRDFVQPAFKAAGLQEPSQPTVYRYIANLDPVHVIERRQGARAAKKARAAKMGKFPFGTAPLSCVQIDYWNYDAEIVDDLDRMPIGRPWLALIIDTHTCMPYGYTLTLDPPSANTAGTAIFHGIMRKEAWLREIGFDMVWPVWGLPQILMADNAKEFRGTMLRRFLCEADRELLNRPVKRPEYGAHIERFFGTLAHRVKSIPGATGSNVKERETRKSEKTARLTLHDLEVHLLSVLAEYINTEHASLNGLTPLQKWRSCFFEDGVQVRELPEEPADPEQLRKELLPFKPLTLQSYGVVWDKIKYDSDELVAMRQRWAKAKGEKFTVRRDSRDISKIYVWDPDNKRYLTVPYRHTEGPPMSIWEWRAAKAELTAKGITAYTELQVFDVHAERVKRHARLEEADRLTTKMRRQRQQRRSQDVALARESKVIGAAVPPAVKPVRVNQDPSVKRISLMPVPRPIEADDAYDDLDI